VIYFNIITNFLTLFQEQITRARTDGAATHAIHTEILYTHVTSLEGRNSAVSVQPDMSQIWQALYVKVSQTGTTLSDGWGRTCDTTQRALNKVV